MKGQAWGGHLWRSCARRTHFRLCRCLVRRYLGTRRSIACVVFRCRKEPSGCLNSHNTTHEWGCLPSVRWKERPSVFRRSIFTQSSCNLVETNNLSQHLYHVSLSPTISNRLLQPLTDTRVTHQLRSLLPAAPRRDAPQDTHSQDEAPSKPQRRG